MRIPLCLGLLAALLAAPGLAAAQDAVSATAPRLLADGVNTLKGDDGARVTLRSTMTYDPVAGEYVREVFDAATGAFVERTVLTSPMIRPTAEEDAAAKALILADPEVAALVAAAAYPVQVEGGFPLMREAGHGCGPGSRCLQYDVFEVGPGELGAERLRYVVVDLRTLTLFSNDFDVVREGNLAHPDAARSSR